MMIMKMATKMMMGMRMMMMLLWQPCGRVSVCESGVEWDAAKEIRVLPSVLISGVKRLYNEQLQKLRNDIEMNNIEK